MSNPTVFRLILFNLLQFKVQNAIVFHCWPKDALYSLTQLMNENNIFSQFVDIEESKYLANIHKNYLDTDLTKFGIILDLNCSQSVAVTNQSSRARLYNHNYHWLLYDESGNTDTVIEHFKHANLSINADITYIKPSCDEKNNYILYDVYNKGSWLGGHLNITIDQSVHCNPSQCEVQKYLSTLHERTRMQQRQDLTGITFRFATLISAMPLNSSMEQLLAFLNSEESKHLDAISRMGYQITLLMQQMLHFGLSYHLVETWSIKDYIGGAMGLLVNESVEISSSPFVLSLDRLRFVHPMIYFSEFRAVCIFRTPHNAGIKAAVFLEPFQPSVWFAFAILLAFAGVLLWLIFHLEHRLMEQYLEFMPSLLTVCLISFGSACIQASYLIPKSTGGRFAFIAVMLTSFLMYNYYTSILVSTLLGSPVRSSIRTIQQLADSSLDVGFDTVPHTKAYVTSSQRPDIRSLFKQKVEGKRDASNIWLSPEVGVLKVRDQPGFVYASEASFMYHFVEKYYRPHEIADLNEIKLRPESALYTIIHKNSTYKELLKQIQSRMLESGITSKLSRAYIKVKVHTFSKSYVINVGMEYAAPLFISLVVSYIIALLILLMELTWQKCGKEKLKPLLRFAYLANTGNAYTNYINIGTENVNRNNLLEIMIKHNLLKLGIFMDINCNQSDYILDVANSEQLYGPRLHWLIYDHGFSFQRMIKQFSQAQLYINTDLTYVIRNPTNNHFILYDLYNKGKHIGGQLNITIDREIACTETQCNLHRYLSNLYVRDRLQHRRFLTNLTLRITAVINTKPLNTSIEELLEFLGSQNQINVDTYARFSFQSRKILMDILGCNFTYIFRDRWTSDDLSGGLIGDLWDSKADIATAPFIYSPSRARYFQALTQFCSFRAVCMFRNPQSATAGFKFSEFLDPFCWSVWLVFVGVLLLAGVILWLTFRLEQREWKPSLLTSCLLSFGAACIQGAWLTPNSTGGRMAFYALMLTSFLMYNYYTSVVVSTLLGQPAKSNIKTVQQLADSNLDVGLEPAPYIKIYLETSDQPAVHSLYLNKIKNSKKSPDRIWLPAEQGVKLVREHPGFVFIAEAALSYEFIRKYYLPHEICELNEILLREETVTHTMVLKSSQYAELIKLR
ncbi:ionotropic receptor 75a-like [Drosophila tropicalis]|uniref:ionotropic receptor 75a-like n=1 Tax=Drosophila tropicalis TaxID=46794 RepID=UPI0035AB75AE